MERSKEGTEERSSNSISLTNQNIILINIIWYYVTKYGIMLQNMVLCYIIWYYVTLYGIVTKYGNMLQNMALCYKIWYYVTKYGIMLQNMVFTKYGKSTMKFNFIVPVNSTDTPSDHSMHQGRILEISCDIINILRFHHDRCMGNKLIFTNQFRKWIWHLKLNG